uniref:Uncharacterized protein n=1 Tax=Arundo donax TaxID=35708 RepID=A0A0A9BJA2_ARUDO
MSCFNSCFPLECEPLQYCTVVDTYV